MHQLLCRMHPDSTVHPPAEWFRQNTAARPGRMRQFVRCIGCVVGGLGIRREHRQRANEVFARRTDFEPRGSSPLVKIRMQILF